MPRRQSWYKYQCRPLTPPKSQPTTSSTELRSAERNKFRPPRLWHVVQSTDAGGRSGRSSVPVHKVLPRTLGRAVPVQDSLLLRSPGVRPDYEWREPHNVVCRSSCGENSVGQKQTPTERNRPSSVPNKNDGGRSGSLSVPVPNGPPEKHSGEPEPVPDSLLLRHPRGRPDYEWHEPLTVVW